MLPLQSLYILSLLLFAIDNGNYFLVNAEIYISARNKSNLHLPIFNLSVYQKGTHYSGIRVFNGLPSQIKDLSHNRSQFKVPWKISCIFFHFVPWMNILAIIRFKIFTIVYQFFMFSKLHLENCWPINWS